VAAKANECNDLKRQNTALMEENARFRSLAEKLLAHPAFHPFLEDLSRDPSLAESLSKVTGNMSSQMPKDLDPYNASQQYAPPPHSGDTTVGMTLIPEVPLDLSALTLGTGAGWNLPTGRSQQPMATYQQSQVFAVTELPAGPVDPLDFGAALSGKGAEVDASFTEVEEAEKATAPLCHDVPVEEEPAKKEFVIDENDETMCLFASSAPKEVAAVAEKETFEPIFGEIAPEKAFAHFELFVSSEEDNSLLLDRFERMMARLDKSYHRLESLVFE
jgi:hypothetical protein